MVISADNLGLMIENNAVFEHVSFGLTGGETLILCGSPGSGKTSLGLTTCGLSGFLDSSAKVSGRLTLFDTPVVQGEHRREAGVILDNPYVQISGMKRTVAEELGFSLECQGIQRREIHERVHVMLEKLGIEKLAQQKIRTLSGGELQRVIIGACLITEPRYLFLDRPLTEIDDNFRDELITVFRNHIAVSDGAAILAEDPWLLHNSLFHKTLWLGDTQEQHIIPVSLPFSATDDIALVIHNMDFAYPGANPLFNQFSLEVLRGHALIVEGPNGAGKTTLAKLVSGIEQSLSGSISIGGCDTSTLSVDETLTLVGFAPQNPDIVLCRKTVREELALAAAWGNDPTPLIGVLGLETLMDTHPLEMTRAEKKRLSIALAYGQKRKVIFLDEPTQYQDTAGFMKILRTVESMVGSGMAVILISHDPRLKTALPDVPAIRLSPGDRH